MKHLKNAQDKATDSKVYRYTVGFLLLLGEATKTVLLGIFNHMTEFLIVIAIALMFCMAELWNCGSVQNNILVLFLVIVGILIIALLKIKILESQKKK